MAVFPSVFFNFQYGTQGWTERYWYATNASLTQVAADGLALLKLRTKMFNVQVEIPWAYASYDDVFRDVQPIVPLPLRTGDPLAWNSVLGISVAQPAECVVARVFSGTRAAKFIYLAGLPNLDTEFRTLYDPAVRGTWRIAFENFIGDPAIPSSALAGGKWGWKGVSYDNVLAPPTTVNTLVAGDGEWVATVADATALKVGKLAKLSDADFDPQTGVNRANRLYLVTAKAGNVVTLSWRGANLDGITYLANGILRPQVFTILPITGGVIDKLGTRKRGVGFGRQAGRRKVG